MELVSAPVEASDSGAGPLSEQCRHHSCTDAAVTQQNADLCLGGGTNDRNNNNLMNQPTNSNRNLSHDHHDGKSREQQQLSSCHNHHHHHSPRDFLSWSWWWLSWMRCCCQAILWTLSQQLSLDWVTRRVPFSGSAPTKATLSNKNKSTPHTRTFSRGCQPCAIPKPLLLVVLLLLLSTSAHANDATGNDDDDLTYATSNNNNNNAVINSEAFLYVHSSCDNNNGREWESNSIAGAKVKVTSVYLICDSPGAYYQGSKTYRNSAVCTEGDTAKLTVGLTIKNSGNDNGDDDIIKMSMDAGYYNVFSNIYSSSKLCKMDIESTTGAECPEPGQYTLNLSYEVLKGASDDEYETVHYTPDIRLRFSNSQGQFAGCATAGMRGWRRSHEVKARNGIIALGAAVLAFGVTFALLLYLSYRRRKRLENLAERKTEQYQYFGTLPNGKVVPFPSQQQRQQQQEQQHDNQHQQHAHEQQMQNLEHMRRLQQQHAQYMMHQQQMQQQQHQGLAEYHHHQPHQQQFVYDDSYSEEGTPQRPHHQHHHNAISSSQRDQANDNNNNNNIHMISNPSYNETHLPTRPII